MLPGKGRSIAADDDHEVILLTEEIASIDEQIKSLHELKKSLIAQREQKLRSKLSPSGTSLAGSSIPTAPHSIDYTKHNFDWTDELLPRAKATWGISSFRSCQKAVCNAALDGRDVVCVMPTGGGKSLCYQLPAILSVGLTLVISPLISLSMDQCWHLREANIACEMMYSGNTREESTSILQRVKMTGASPKDRIKVLFVTPERIVKSKMLLAALQKCYERDQLARIVIDEAHCCSQVSQSGTRCRFSYQCLRSYPLLYIDGPRLSTRLQEALNSAQDLPQRAHHVSVSHLVPQSSRRCAKHSRSPFRRRSISRTTK